MRRRTFFLAGIALIAAIAAGTTSAAGTAGRGTVTLTLWHNYGGDAKATATKALVTAYEKLHPNIRINVVSQPPDNYFALLNAAAISHTGPDISNQWTGLYDLKYARDLVNLKPYLTAKQLASINGAAYEAPNFDPASGLLTVPIANAFYIGFYNKALFRKAGITSVPATWSELSSACQKLKAIGVAPMEYGLTGSYVLGQQFYPWFDASYLMIGAFSSAQWRGLYSGQIPWTSPRVIAQVNKWVALRQSGCTNKDVLTQGNTLTALAKGKAAMIVDGDWDLAALEKQMGSNLGVFVPPFSDHPVRGVVQYPGEGLSVMNYSAHKTEAIDFVKFLLTAQANKIIAGEGLIPNIKGFRTTDPLSNQLLDFASKRGYAPYPMLDNVVQPEVVTTGAKELTAAFAGDVSVQKALSEMQATLLGLPASRRGRTYTGG
jgi:ABC-type glycerol-3-phosphate transport system substrate-binding protein